MERSVGVDPADLFFYALFRSGVCQMSEEK